MSLKFKQTETAVSHRLSATLVDSNFAILINEISLFNAIQCTSSVTAR